MQVDFACQAKVLAFVANQDRVHHPWIQMQMHTQAAQGQVDFEQEVVDAHGAVLVHAALDAGVEEWLQIQVRIQGAQKRQGPGEAFLRAFTDAFVFAGVINLLQPLSKLAVEFLQRADGLAGQAQARFKVLLHGAEHSLNFAPAPGLAWLGVNQTDAQVGTDDLEVLVDEGPSIIHVEFSGQTSSADALFEASQKRVNVGRQSIGPEGNQAGMIIDDQTQMSGAGLGRHRQEGPGGEVGAPQIVDPGSLEGFGGAGNVLAQQIAPAMGIQIVLFQPTINR